MATATPPPAAAPEPAPPPDLKILWIRLALFFAVIGVLGSLHLSINMGLQACPLCYYQRAFIMAAAGILAFGMFLEGVPAGAVSVLALVPSVAGLCLAGQHSRLEWAGDLECPKGITGALVVPQESFLIFALLVAALAGDVFVRKTYVIQAVGAALLGVVFCTTGLRSVQRMDPPTAPYEKTEPDGCRKPYKKAEAT
jgi:disulfide bond formation protein DsbB